VGILAEHRFFAGLPRAELERLVAQGHQRRYRAREPIFQKGDPGDGLYVIVDGSVQVAATSFEGKKITLNLMEARQVFGEIALLDGGPRTADAIAWTPTTLVHITRRPVLELLARQPDFALAIIHLLCERLRWTSEVIEDSLLLHMPRRLAKRLLLLLERFGQQGRDGTAINIGLSQEELGSFTGVTRESVNKQLNLWRSKGIIDIVGGQILVKRPDVLRTLIEGD
jgi:CRP-like cAMP-binding protein